MVFHLKDSLKKNKISLYFYIKLSMLFWYAVRKKHLIIIYKNRYKNQFKNILRNLIYIIRNNVYAEIYREYKNQRLQIIKYCVLATKNIIISFLFNKNNKNQTEEFIKEIVSFCLSKNTSFWWEDISNPTPYNLPNIYKNILLRRIGDVDKFLYFDKKYKEIFFFRLAGQDFYLNLSKYFLNQKKEILKIKNEKKSKDNLLISFSCWGENYIDSFLVYCLPSLLAKGNFPYLVKHREVIINIYTDKEGIKLSENSKSVTQTKKLGIKFIYQMLNKDLLKNIATNLDHRYWHLGMIQSLSLFMAKKLEADFHLLMPDTIYSENHFKGLIKAHLRGNEVITSLGLSTVKEKIKIKIEKYRLQNGIINVPASDLASLSIQNIHYACESWLSTNKNLNDELPNLFMIAWEGENSLHMMSPHQTILYVNKKIMAKIEDRFFLTLDGELDALIPQNAIIYTPQKEDDIYLIEITSQEQQRFVKNKRNHISEFCRLFWYAAQNSKGYLRFAKQTISIPLNRKILLKREFMLDKDIKSSNITLIDSLIENYPFPEESKINFASKLLKEIIKDNNYSHSLLKAKKILSSLELKIKMVKEFKEFNDLGDRIQQGGKFINQYGIKNIGSEDEILFLEKVKLLLTLENIIPDSQIYIAYILSRYEEYFKLNNFEMQIPHLDNLRLERHKKFLSISTNNSPIGFIYKQVINLCIKNKINDWHNFILKFEKDSIPQLFFFLRECIFRRIGDYQKYLSFVSQIQNLGIEIPENEQCYVDCASHFKNVIVRINNNSITKKISLKNKNEKRIVIGLSCWGEDFLDSFLSLCLPSLISNGNLHELVKHRKVIFVIHTNDAGISVISSSKIIKKIETMGINIIYELINNQLLGWIMKDPNFIYWHLGMCQSIELSIASKLNADYHLLMPDTIYSNNHFKGIIKIIAKNEKVITRVMLSAKKEKIKVELEKYKNKNNAISVPASDLCAMCLKYISVLSENWLITNNDIKKDMPSDPFVAFESESSLQIFAAHQTILFLSQEIVKANEKRFFAALDSELDLLIPMNTNLYLPQINDEVFVIALNSESRKLISEPNVSLTPFASKFWLSCNNSKSSWRFFEKSSTDRINRKLLPNRVFMKQEDIYNTSEAIKKFLLSKLPELTLDEIKSKKIIESKV